MSKKNKQIILAVTNDLATDQRMHKVANTLKKAGFAPMLVGRKFKNSKELGNRSYTTKRFRLWFKKGPLFYANYNLRLFFFLLFKKSEVFVANDLDTLPACYYAYRLKKIFRNKTIKLVYDSHELFTEVPELNGRNFVKKTWLFIEKLILPKIKNSYTVCQSIADEYYEKYKVKMKLVYNYPYYESTKTKSPKLYIELPDNQKIILYQGALNIGRGIEHVINLMDKIEGVKFVIAGKGDIEEELKNLVKDNQLNDKVIFTGVIPLEQLSDLTKKADLGLVLQEDFSLSYRYVLPNRLFDFMKAEVPILASNLPELNKIVSKEKIGLLIDCFEPDELLNKIKKLLFNENLITEVKSNLKKCNRKYSWESQEKMLTEFYKNLN
jgi:glycosyltransferase involved in cell wall biosynthesis